MQFDRIEPPNRLKHLVECYWIVKSTDATPALQKIIPDGFPEIIFHFGDPYKIELKSSWETQGSSLLAGQITKYFFLENTGRSDILGIKLKPAAVTQLFSTDMSSLKDKVITLQEFGNPELTIISQSVHAIQDDNARIKIINDRFVELASSAHENPLEKAIACIFSSNGMLGMTSLCDQCKITERQLERLFKKYIGLPPK